MTFDHVIVFNEARCPWPPPRRLLVHELVHVAQYERLGVHGFAEEYVVGWIRAGYEYRRIPLEVEAYGVERDFVARGEPGPVKPPAASGDPSTRASAP